jgi:membrane-associated phospholipid phosphatase
MVETYGGLMARKETAPGFAFNVSPIKEGGLFAATVGIALCGYVVGPRYIKRDYLRCDSSTINRFDRGAVRWHSRVLGPLSYAIGAAAFITPVIVSIRDRGFGRKLAEDLWVYAETFAVSTALNIVTKTLVQRPIPGLYTGLYPELEKKASGYRSFYSGHTAQITGALVASAIMSHLRGQKRVWPWALAAIGTAAISVARVGAGRHFYSDVAAGALAGGMVGSLVPLLHPVRCCIGESGG